MAITKAVSYTHLCRLVVEPVVNPVVGQKAEKPRQEPPFLSLTTMTTKISKKKKKVSNKSRPAR